MEMKRWDRIIALKPGSGAILGFHSENLEVAELSEEIWETMANPDFDRDALEQLTEWNVEKSSETKTEKVLLKTHSLSINVSQLCNLQCLYCAAGGDGSYGNPQKRISVEKTIPQIEILMDRLAKDDMFSITFLGGEPLLYPLGMSLIADFAKTKAREKSLRLAFTTITNGTLLSQENIEVLKSFRSQVILSLDGEPGLNDRVRPAKNSKPMTCEILKGLDRLLEQKSHLAGIGIQGVFGPHNPSPLQAYFFYDRLGVDWIDFHFDQESSDPVSSQAFAADLAEIARLAFHTGGEEKLRKVKFFDQIFHQLDSKTRIENHCGIGKSYLVLDSQNRAFSCPWSVNEPASSVGSGTDLDLQNLQTIKNSLISANNCHDCWARYLCGGGCLWAHRQATGNQHLVDPVFCSRMRALISTGLLYYERARKGSDRHEKREKPENHENPYQKDPAAAFNTTTRNFASLPSPERPLTWNQLDVQFPG